MRKPAFRYAQTARVLNILRACASCLEHAQFAQQLLNLVELIRLRKCIFVNLRYDFLDYAQVVFHSKGLIINQNMSESNLMPELSLHLNIQSLCRCLG